MFITKMSLPRRTFLRGVGATIALAVARRDGPGVHGDREAAAAPVRRFAGIYVPHGCIMDRFTPGAGRRRASSSRRS